MRLYLVQVIAAGGRYDGLVAKFQPPNSTSSAVAAVGVNIAIAKLISSFIAYETRKAKNEGRKLR
jgi:histidyl-tRNA synthetase